MRPTLHLGHVLHVAGGGEVEDAPTALREHRRGAILVDGQGRIVSCGDRDAIAAPPDVARADHGDAFLLPGFVDAHLHFPQLYAQACFGGGQLLEWLERCIFPAEARFADAGFARRAAADFCDALVAAGTTCALVYGSQFPAAQDALFAELARRGLRAIAGRTTMVAGPPSAAALLTTTEDALRLCREEIERHHPPAHALDDALVHVALIPRYALSLTPEALRALGELHAEMAQRGVRFSTHLSENARPRDGEVSRVFEGFGVRRYLDAYDGRFLPGSARGGESFLGPRSVFAHAVHCGDDEYRRLAETGSSIAHCPESQLFLGSGTMPWRRVRAARVRIAAGSDVAAGDSFSIPQVLATAWKVHMSAPGDEALALHPTELLHLGTLGGAQALGLDHRIGNFDPGKEADFVVAEPADPLLARRLKQQEGGDAAARLFTLLASFRGVRIRHVHVRGRRVGPDPR